MSTLKTLSDEGSNFDAVYAALSDHFVVEALSLKRQLSESDDLINEIPDKEFACRYKLALDEGQHTARDILKREASKEAIILLTLASCGGIYAILGLPFYQVISIIFLVLFIIYLIRTYRTRTALSIQAYRNELSDAARRSFSSAILKLASNRRKRRELESTQIVEGHNAAG